MSHAGETFFTVLGCMDGRCQEAVAEYGRKKFDAKYPDTITEAGLVGLLANEPSKKLLESLKKKIVISLEKHHSKGILIDGHAECAGDPVSDEAHKDHVRRTVDVVKSLAGLTVPVIGVFIRRCPQNTTVWEVEEISQTLVV